MLKLRDTKAVLLFLLFSYALVSIPHLTFGQTPMPAPGPPLLTLENAHELALKQASAFEQAKIAELSAAEDVLQSRAAFYPRITANPTFIYNSPSRGATDPGSFSFIGANAITEIQALAGASGEIDLSGKLRASLRKSSALLEAAKAGSEIARRALLQAVDDAYFAVSLGAARRQAAGNNLETAKAFVELTKKLVVGGEVAQVDLLRAELQLNGRVDDLEQAKAAEEIALVNLRLLIGYDASQKIRTLDLLATTPLPADTEGINAEQIRNRPEFAFFDAQRRAADNDVRAARAERRPQLSYSLVGGFASDSLKPTPLRLHSGVLATVSLNIPIFDFGASRSRERQALQRKQQVESTAKLAALSLTQLYQSSEIQSRSARIRIANATSGLSAAQQNLEISISRYKAGEAQIIEVSDAQNTLNSQRFALAQALYDYQVALAHLREEVREGQARVVLLRRGLARGRAPLPRLLPPQGLPRHPQHRRRRRGHELPAAGA